MAREGAHDERVRRLAEALRSGGPAPGPTQPCPYLPQREARFEAFTLGECPPGLYHALMDLNYRRSGPAFYRPTCAGCSECRALRVLVQEFRPSRAQRRCWALNGDLVVSIGSPRADEERLELYQRYLAARHDGQMQGSLDELAGSLCATRVETVEYAFRRDGRLVAIGLADREPAALSAVYCYFDPLQRRRSLGVFNVLWLIEEARQSGRAFVYLGYLVAGSRKMSYKASYRPNQILEPGRGFVLGG